MKYILVYGSLRKFGPDGKPEFNFGRFGENSQIYVSTHTLKNYELYNFGFYPGVLKYGSGNLVVELHQVDDKTFARIEAMERGAGYHAETIEVAGVTATLYVFNNESIRESCDRIPTGNWSDRKKAAYAY